MPLKIVNYCLTEDKNVMLCLEGFLGKVSEEIDKSTKGKYYIQFSLWRKE